MYVRAQARNVTLRVELPPMDGAGGPCALVIVRLEALTYAGALFSVPFSLRFFEVVSLPAAVLASSCTARQWLGVFSLPSIVQGHDYATAMVCSLPAGLSATAQTLWARGGILCTLSKRIQLTSVLMQVRRHRQRATHCRGCLQRQRRARSRGMPGPRLIRL